MLMSTETTHPFPYMRDCIETWDSLSEEVREKLTPLLGGQKFLDRIASNRIFLARIASAKYN